VDAARRVDHGLQMLVDGLLIDRVDLRRLGRSAGGNDLLGDHFDRCQVASGEKEPGPLRCEGACYRTTDRASGAVDDRDLVFQQHRWFPSRPGRAHTFPIRR
jgi:hypothetical protein